MGEKKETVNSSEEKKVSEKTSLNRRTLLKALTGVPVLGILGFSAMNKWKYDQRKNKRIVQELGLEELSLPDFLNEPSATKGDLLRIGIIGFGSRSQALAGALGYLHPSEIERRKKNGTLGDWLAQEDLNVSITGICDVFDLHAERGMTIAGNKIRTGEEKSKNLPVKRYNHYQDMLEDKDIDAVVIATPDHHHARITVDAIKAGKHVYCEKSMALTEKELFDVYNTVKSHKPVYQLGHQYTKNIIFHQAKQLIEKNILGKITHVETTSNRNTAEGAWIRHLDVNGNPKPGDEKSIDWLQWLGDRPYQPFSKDRFYNWTKWFDYGSGLISQLFTHEFDAVNLLMEVGIPASVVSSGGIYYWKDNREMADLLNCVFEYPDRELSLVYSGNLASSRSRGRIFMGNDAFMELGGNLKITIDRNSTRFKTEIQNGIIDTSIPIINLSPGSESVDAVTSATEKYYASRGLVSTQVNGRRVDITYLHVKEWTDFIRKGKAPDAVIERAFEEGVTCIMAHKSYVEKRRVEWDPVNRRIV